MDTKTKLKLLWNKGLISFIDIPLRILYAKMKSLPTSLMVEPTQLCNLNCSICYTQKIKLRRRNNFMSFGEFKQIIDNVKNHCVYLSLWFAGEPLLNNELADMIAYADRNGIITCVSTNAVLLTKEKIKELVDAGLDRIIISFDGATKESYEKIRIGANFDEVIKNIENLIEYKEDCPLVFLQLIVTKDNEHEIPLFKELANKLKVDEAYTKSLYTFDTDSSELKKKLKKLLPSKPFRRKIITDIKEKMRNCNAPRRAVIQCDSNLISCCFDVRSLYVWGNLKSQSFREIWNTKRYKAFRKDTQKFTKSSLCSKCGCKQDYILERVK